jgi:hypothetical protein
MHDLHQSLIRFLSEIRGDKGSIYVFSISIKSVGMHIHFVPFRVYKHKIKISAIRLRNVFVTSRNQS